MAEATATGYIALSVTMSLCICSAGLTLWFHKRRAFQPIRSRFWWQSEAIVAIILIWAVYLSFALEFPGLGQTFFLFSYAFLMNSAFAVLIRLSHIYSAYSVAAVYAAWSSSDGAEDIHKRLAKSGFYVRYGDTVQNPRVQAIAMVTHALLQAVLWGVTVSVTGEFTVDEELMAAGIVLLFYITPMFYFAYKVVYINDGLFLRREMFAIAVVAAVLGVAFVAVRLLVEDRLYAGLVVLFGTPYPIILILVGFPLYKSYAWQAEAKRFMAEGGHDGPFESFYLESNISSTNSGRESFEEKHPEVQRKETREIEAIEAIGVERETAQEKRRLPRLELNQVLVHPAGRMAFIAFCKQELNHETVLFFLDATKLLLLLKSKEQVASEEEVAQRASTLYHNYIKAGAALQVNLSYDMRVAFVEAGVSGTEEVAEEINIDKDALSTALRVARDEIYQLMVKGPFVRFLRHKLYDDFIAAMDQEV